MQPLFGRFFVVTARLTLSIDWNANTIVALTSTIVAASIVPSFDFVGNTHTEAHTSVHAFL